MAEVADGGGGSATEFEWLSYRLYADRPEQIRAAAGPWTGVARLVEHAAAVLEDGQVKLAEVWRSPAGQLYLSKMGEVTQAMRDISVVARHNGQVMDAAADALDARQKDFGMLSTAPIPEDARTGFARAIVRSLDESYQQATADFRPVPAAPDPNIGQDPARTGESDNTGSRQRANLGRSSVSAGSMSHTGEAPTMPQRLPSWVPTQPATVAMPDSAFGPPPPDGGSQLQGISPDPSPASWTESPGNPGSLPGASPAAAPGGQVPPPAVGSLPHGPNGAGTGPVGMAPRSTGPRPPSGQQPWPPGQPQTPGATYSGDAAGRPGIGARPAPGTRVGSGEPGAMVGGVPTGGADSAGRSGWQGYRRPAERFPTTEQTAVAPLIGTVPEEPELISTDYADEYGNRITIRRPA